MFGGVHHERKTGWVVVLAAVAAMVPLMVHGGSCGHDLLFHVESWLDAARQLRHGAYPQWAGTAAWNAGEPRFVFYPPLSWLVGAVLVMVLPVGAAPVVFVGLVLAAAGLTFYRLAREFVGGGAAMVGTALYVANPYMLFCALERSAMAELMAAAWMPLLLLAVLRRRPTIRRLAVAVALLWLTNAPAAVVGSYAVAVVAVVRMVGAMRWPEDGARRGAAALRLAAAYGLGGVLGLALPAFYLVPAAYERKFVAIAMAVIPELRPENNFLFAHTADAAHDAVNHAVSVVAVVLLVVAAVGVAVTWWMGRRGGGAVRLERSAVEQEALAAHLHLVHRPVAERVERPVYLVPVLGVVSGVVAVLLTPVSREVWKLGPELVFLQFPWRLLVLLAPVVALLVGVALDDARLLGGVWTTRGRGVVGASAVGVALVLGVVGFHLYGQACEAGETPAALAQLLATHHGTLPTDEYTPVDADNDVLRTDDPGYWLIPEDAGKRADVNAPAPGTVPTATEMNPAIDTDDTPVAESATISEAAPRTLTLDLKVPEVLVLHLREYPRWRVTDETMAAYPEHVTREDGLLAVRLPAGRSTVEVGWSGGDDATLGVALSVVALLALVVPTAVRRRRRGRRGSEDVAGVA